MRGERWRNAGVTKNAHHRDQTIAGRTLAHHGGPPAFYRWHGSVSRSTNMSQRQYVRFQNLINGLQHWAQAAMDTKNAAIYDGAQREIIENFTTPAPHVAAAVLALAFVVKPVDLRDLPRLVVSTDESYSIRISHFERQEEEERFNAVETSIHEVS